MELRHTVTALEEGRTVKSILRDTLHLSSAGLRRMKAAGSFSLNGERVFVTARVRPGDVVAAELRETPPAFPPEEGLLSVTYEDEHLLAVDKPRGIILHPTHSRFTGTLANLAWGHIRERGGEGCHALNRLDRDTGGVVLFGKNAWAAANTALVPGGKQYLAVVCGEPDAESGAVEFPIARISPGDMKRVCDPAGQAARTDWRLLRTREGLSLLSLTLHTGRTHQIRVHMAAQGWPLVGDRLYGTPESLRRSEAMGEGMQALWCRELRARHPLTGEELRFSVRPSAEILSFFDFSP